jgi:membrane protein
MSDTSQDMFSDLIARARSEDSSLGRVLGSRPARVLRGTVERFERNNDLLWAAALTYTTGLSIVPILAVAFSALEGLGGGNLIRPLIERFVGANSPEITNRLLELVSHVNARTLGIVGAGSLLFTVVLTLGTIEQAFNQIFHVAQGRSLGRRFADYLSVTFAIPLLLASALGVREILVNHLPHIRGAGWIGSTIAIWAAFFFLYMFFPNCKVRLRAAAVGSFVAGILLQLAQWAFIYFQIGAIGYSAIYGALAAVPIVLTWIYMIWLIVLLGGELTGAIELPNDPVSELSAEGEWAVALMVVLRLGERMAGRTQTVVTLAGLAVELGVDAGTLADVLRRLESGGLIVESDGAGVAKGGLFLARDSTSIALDEVLNCVRLYGPAAGAADSRVAETIKQLRAAEHDVLGALTVKDLVERNRVLRP